MSTDDEAPRDPLARAAPFILRDVGTFSRLLLPRRALRPYQVEPARAIAASVAQELGRSFAVVFSRQAGKDELLAQTVAFLLLRWQWRGGSVVVAAPTFPNESAARDRVTSAGSKRI